MALLLEQFLWTPDQRYVDSYLSGRCVRNEDSMENALVATFFIQLESASQALFRN